jgi:hypothetical protein
MGNPHVRLSCQVQPHKEIKISWHLLVTSWRKGDSDRRPEVLLDVVDVAKVISDDENLRLVDIVQGEAGSSDLHGRQTYPRNVFE